MPRDTDFATLAGLIEADGSVGICVNNPTTHIVRVRFFNTDTELIDWVNQVFGGRVGIGTSNTSYGQDKICLKVEWNGKKAQPILERISPYFHGNKGKVVQYALQHLSCDNLNEKEVIAEAMHILNLRGGK